MRKKIKWIPFSKALPPLGVPVIIKYYHSWEDPEADKVCRVVKIDAKDSDSVLPVTSIRKERSKNWCTSTCLYREHASWVSASGHTPTEEELALGRRYVKTYLAKEKRAKEARHQAATHDWVKRKARRLKLEQRPLSQVKPIEAHGQRVHYQYDPQDWELKSDPFKRSTPLCGTVASGPLTIYPHQVTCLKCRRSLAPSPPVVTIRLPLPIGMLQF